MMQDPGLPRSVLSMRLKNARRRVKEAEARLQREVKRDAADSRKPGRAWRYKESERLVRSARGKLIWARRRRRRIAEALVAQLFD